MSKRKHISGGTDEAGRSLEPTSARTEPESKVDATHIMEGLGLSGLLPPDDPVDMCEETIWKALTNAPADFQYWQQFHEIDQSQDRLTEVLDWLRAESATEEERLKSCCAMYASGRKFDDVLAFWQRTAPPKRPVGKPIVIKIRHAAVRAFAMRIHRPELTWPKVLDAVCPCDKGRHDKNCQKNIQDRYNRLRDVLRGPEQVEGYAEQYPFALVPTIWLERERRRKRVNEPVPLPGASEIDYPIPVEHVPVTSSTKNPARKRASDHPPKMTQEKRNSEVKPRRKSQISSARR